MSGENKNADVQWLVTLASDGIWPSVTEVGPSVLSPSLCSTVLFPSVYSAVPQPVCTVLFSSVHSAVPTCPLACVVQCFSTVLSQPVRHTPIVCPTLPLSLNTQAKSPNPGDMYECSAPESQHEAEEA